MKLKLQSDNKKNKLDHFKTVCGMALADSM